jgi:hypothetical protein
MNRRVRTRTAALALRATLGAALGAATACDDHPTRPAHELQLERARQATETYRNIDRAIADGYVDIDVVMPRMGRHFLKAELLDATFDAERPELLVYTPDGARLVAVEYAVPLAQSAAAPAGFSGGDDVWDRNETFQLWTLHAWVFESNPDGVFAAHNPRVP